MRKMAVSIDYEPLAVARYQQFFDTMSVRTDSAPFSVRTCSDRTRVGASWT